MASIATTIHALRRGDEELAGTVLDMMVHLRVSRFLGCTTLATESELLSLLWGHRHDYTTLRRVGQTLRCWRYVRPTGKAAALKEDGLWLAARGASDCEVRGFSADQGKSLRPQAASGGSDGSPRLAGFAYLTILNFISLCSLTLFVSLRLSSLGGIRPNMFPLSTSLTYPGTLYQ